MATRTGVPTMLYLSKKLVRIITKFLPVLQTEFPDNEDLLTAVQDCANCLTSLIALLAEVRDTGD